MRVAVIARLAATPSKFEHRSSSRCVTISVPIDDDTCGQALQGQTFDAYIVLYHAQASAWVVREIDTGAHYFVDASFIVGDVANVPKPQVARCQKRRMECLVQNGARERNPDTGQVTLISNGGCAIWINGFSLYEIRNENDDVWYLMRVPRYDGKDFYGGYAIGTICDNDMRFN